MTDPARERAVEVIRTLRSAGYVALLAGGAVRDLLLGRDAQDYDVATSARPDQVAACFDTVVPVGERFGVVLVVAGGRPVEVATFRHDAVYADGRHPVAVTFTDRPEDDARRRDFTVNGLFLDPDSGEIFDCTGGREDARRRVLRAIGDPRERFDEDRLRLLRAVRLATTLEFEIEEETYRAIRERAPEIASVSGERIRDEILRLLTAPRARRGLELLLVTGLMEAILPEVAAMPGVLQPPRFHPEGDVWVHTLLAVEALESPSGVVALGTLLHDVGKPPTRTVAERARFDRHPQVGAEMAGEICRRLRMSRRDTDRVVDLVASHLLFMDVTRMREAKLRRLLAGPEGAEHLAVHRADCMASHRGLVHYDFSVRRREEYLREEAPPPRLLTGHDLIGLGLVPGPEFARILADAEDLTLTGRLRSREEALDWARTRFAAGGNSNGT